MTKVGAPLPHSCGKCEARWGGFKTCHCSGCHETFSTPGNFDRHRERGVKCKTGQESGLVVHSRGSYNVWLQAAEQLEGENS